MYPIHVACSTKSEEILKTLLERAINVDMYDHKHRTPLHIASKKNWKEGVIMLIKAGANKNILTPDKMLPIEY